MVLCSNLFFLSPLSFNRISQLEKEFAEEFAKKLEAAKESAKRRHSSVVSENSTKKRKLV